MMEHSFPAVLGKDFAGTVAATGEGVSGWAVGDRVFGVVMKPLVRDGSFAQYVTVPEAIGIAHLPEGLDVHVAGALGLAGTAAIQAVDALQLQAGELVLVAGATGGVGALAVQLAAAAGAVVIATGRPGLEEKFLRELGATHIADCSQDLAAPVRALALQGAAPGDGGDGQPRRRHSGPAGRPGRKRAAAGSGAGDLPFGGAAPGDQRLQRRDQGQARPLHPLSSAKTRSD